MILLMQDPPDHEIEIFNAALAEPAPSRPAYVAKACRGDAELHRRVQALLKAHERAGTFLDATPFGDDLLGEQAVHASALDRQFSQAARDVLEPGERIGRYRILEQIGEGGCGVVYMAEQERPVQRCVALKVIKLGMDTKMVVARFQAEQQALAMMDHPNIAKVLDAGTTDAGRPFFVMELVRGTKMTEYCDRNRLPTPRRLDLFTQVCHAVQHAHQKGIIHRDLKPSNILITINDGTPMPKVIDFGIAKATQGRLTAQTLFTAFHQFLGTPAYMSPEQSVLTSVDIDTRSDIYSLGVLLYELLVGQTPFDQNELLAVGLEEMRRTIREKEPPRPSTRLRAMLDQDLQSVAWNRRSEPPKLIHFVRGDLDWIVMKCLEKDRARRYDTVNGLAMDLRRFLRNEPIVARPPTRPYRLWKLIRRHQLGFTATAGVLAALLLGLGFATSQFLAKSKAEAEQSRLRAAAQNAQAGEAQARLRAELHANIARQKAYASDMSLLQQALGADDLVRAQALLDRQRPKPGEPDLRGWEWRYFWQFCQSDVSFTLCRRSNSVTSVSFSGDGSLLAVGTFAGEVTVWDAASRQLVFRYSGPPELASRVAFAPAGNLLAFGDSSNHQTSVVLWDSHTQAEVNRLPLAGALRDLAFSRDGRLFTADLSSSNNIVIWDVATGRPLNEFADRLPTYGMGRVFNITTTGTTFGQVMREDTHSVQITDVAPPRTHRLSVADELATALAFSPDGRMLLTGGGYAEGAIRLWDLETHQLAGTFEGHHSWVGCLKFLPDGKTVASASADGTIRLWDFVSRQPVRTLRGSSGELWTLDVSPDGRWLASGCKDGSVSFWNLGASTNRPVAFRALATGTSEAWSYSPDGRWIAALERGRVKLYDAGTFELVDEPALPLSDLRVFGFSPDMRLLVAADAKGRLCTWDLIGGRVLTNFAAHAAAIVIASASFSRDGQTFVTHGADGTQKEWAVATWKEKSRWHVDPELGQIVAFCPSADIVVAAAPGGAFELVRPSDPAARRRLQGQDRTVAIDLSRDGKMFAAASENGSVEVWRVETVTRGALLHGALLGYHSVAFCPDGERLVAGSNGREAMKMWETHSFEEVATLAGNGSFFADAHFSPDGNSIGARNWNGVIHIWSAPSWKEIEAAERARHDGPL
jgi:WD40 repeat protein/serine/threonine protein kinase